MQTSKARNGSSEVPQKTSPITPKSSRGSKKAGSESDSVSSKLTPGKTSAERSPKITRSPKSPVFAKKRPVRPSDLENEVTRLRDELKKTNDQLNLSESLKKQVQLESEEVMKMLTAMEGKLEESQNQLAEFSIAENVRCQELHKISQERDKAWQSELEALQKQHSDDSVALESLMNEIQRLKQQLDMVMKSETSQVEDSETVQTELAALKQDMEATQSTVENLKVQINEKVIVEQEAKLAASEIQKQLEMANATIESLRSEGCALQQSLNSVTSNLEESRLRVSALEEMVKELQVPVEDDEVEGGKPPSEAESVASESELVLLRAALEAAEAKLHEEQIESTMKIQSAIEMAEHVKVDAGLRELELESTLQKTTAELLDLKARLLSMETELPAISRMNEELKDEMDKAMASQFDSEMRLIKATTEVTELKANLLDKETQLQSIMDENEQLKSELKRDGEHQGNYAAAILDAERAKAAEQEALMRLGVANGEAEKNNKKAAKVLEQLEAAQTVKSEMEAELRRLRVQSDQWRKAAEAAAAVLTPGNNGRIVERTGSLNSDYNSLLPGKLLSSPFSDDLDDESPKRKNGNMLRKIGGLWKKGSK